ncbi:hypothetical protein Ae201684P_001658 [Aphanomyces euteiches]|nr:hypothetical protein Ae201684P_001658 [Aphanomyces euteiches]
MSRRQVQATKQLRIVFSIGVGVGSVGTLLALYEEKSDVVKPQPLPQPDTTSSIPAHEATRFGYPSTNNIKVRDGYVLSYDRRLRNASWVAEYITRESLKKSEDADRLKSSFKADPTTPDIFRVSPSDFHNSGYDRGHLAPATCFVRHLASHYGGVYVITGPLFLPSRQPGSDTYQVTYPIFGSPTKPIAVPTHFFKVVLVEVTRQGQKQYLSAGFVLPNQAIPDKTNLLEFLRPIDFIERVSGLLFFDHLRESTKFLPLCVDVACKLPMIEFKTAKQEAGST